MTLKSLRSIWLAAFAVGIPAFALPGAYAQDSKQAALAAALKNAPMTLEQGLKASEKNGKPISAKFEVDGGKLRLSVYTVSGNTCMEVIVSPDNGAVESAEKITDSGDLKDAEYQKTAMARASATLIAAAERAVAQNAGSLAVSVFPELNYGQPVATVTLLRNGTFSTFSEKLN